MTMVEKNKILHHLTKLKEVFELVYLWIKPIIIIASQNINLTHSITIKVGKISIIIEWRIKFIAKIQDQI